MNITKAVPPSESGNVSMTEAEAMDLMESMEERAISLGYRNFAIAGTEFSISSETQNLIDSKADDNEVVKLDGSVGLTDNWITPYKITAEQIASSIAVGTSPIEVVSTTCVTNLNADTVDGVHASTFATDSTVLKKDGSVALTANWDAGNGRSIYADEIRARDADGLALYEDGESGIFIKNGGYVGVNKIAPILRFHVSNPTGALPNSTAVPVANGIFMIEAENESLNMGMNNASPYGGWIQVQNTGTANTYRPLSLQPVGGQVIIGGTTPTSMLQVVGLPIYANNAGAVAGGLTAGAFYRTNGDPDLVCVVH
jgi:hypothetical protein